MKFVFFVFFPVSENGENGLGDEGADGGNAIVGYNVCSENNFYPQTFSVLPRSGSVSSVDGCTCTAIRHRSPASVSLKMPLISSK